MESRRVTEQADNSALDDAQNPQSFFSKLSSRIAPQKNFSLPNSRTQEALLLLQNYEESRQGWFWSTDQNGRLMYLTDSVAQLLGDGNGALLGTAFTELFLPGDSDGDRQRSLPFIFTKQSKFDDLPLQAAISGDERWWAVSGRPSFDVQISPRNVDPRRIHRNSRCMIR
jgi:hypothetical protein